MPRWDCIVCGEICVDLPIRPVPMRQPLMDIELTPVDAVIPGGGGIVANSGLALARLGSVTAAFCFVGRDDIYAEVLRRILEDGHVDTNYVFSHPIQATSTTAVLIGDDGEHTFAYHGGASRELRKETIMESLDIFAEARYALFGYYALMPNLEDDLPEVFAAIQETGCKVALDSAGGGGCIKPLDRILPYVDIYIPSRVEAQAQTGLDDPRQMIAEYRKYAPNSLLGVKLGADGLLLSPSSDEWITVESVTAPGPVVDTTGAGDSFYAGFLTGLCRGLSVRNAARIGAAAGACCVTQLGATAGIRSLEETCQLANVEMPGESND